MELIEPQLQNDVILSERVTLTISNPVVYMYILLWRLEASLYITHWIYLFRMIQCIKIIFLNNV